MNFFWQIDKEYRPEKNNFRGHRGGMLVIIHEQNVSNGTSTPQGENLCQSILKSMHKLRS